MLQLFYRLLFVRDSLSPLVQSFVYVVIISCAIDLKDLQKDLEVFE